MLKSAHYAAIHLLFKNRHSKRAIAHLTNHDRKTVDKVLRTEAPVLVPRRIRKHKLDAFRKPLEQQLKAGCVTCDQLLSFLRSLGFDGSKRMLQRFVREFRKRQIKGQLTAGVPCGSSLLTASHHWMLRLMQGDIGTKDLQADVGGILSIEDSDLIIETMRTGQFGLRKRALSIAAHLKGIASRPISQFLMVNRESIREYIKRFHDGGLNELFDLNRKEVKKADDLLYKEAVFKSLHSPPRLLGFNRTTWRMQDLQSVLAAQGLRISVCNIRKIIRNAGYRFRKAKKVLTSNDPNYRQKLQAITNILQNLKADEKFFSVDEFGPFAIKIHGGRSLVRTGEIKTIPQFQISKGSLTVTAALEMSENQVTHLYSKRKNTKEVLKLLDLLLEKYAGQSCIYFSWDAASWHASKKLYERVDEINSVEYKSAHHTPIVRLAPLPSSAQFLNVIESVFSGMSRAIIHNSDYQSAEECMLTIDRYFDERNENFRARPKRAGKKIWGKEIVDPAFDEARTTAKIRDGKSEMRRAPTELDQVDFSHT